jgi:hypothetical protein
VARLPHATGDIRVKVISGLHLIGEAASYGGTGTALNTVQQCSVSGGAYWGRAAFVDLAIGPARACAYLYWPVRATFGAVLRRLGHPVAQLPLPPAQPEHVATPTPQPTATPVPQPQYLVNLSGDQDTQSDDFTTSGEFRVSWSADVEDTNVGFGFFSADLYSAGGDLLDSIASTTQSGANTFTEHADCSDGCYIKVSASNMPYQLTSS